MQVPFLDIKAQNRSIGAELDEALAEVIADAQFILGPAVERFEEHFANYLGVPHCIGVNNGSSALHLALLAADVGPGDEVITTPHTWISTSWAISYVGATPVYVDVDPVTYTLNPALVEPAITHRSKAILPVHLYGQAANLTELSALACKHRLLVIEDAAQAHGARHAGRCVGSFGHASCFSFYPGKNLGAFGEAGAVVTSDAGLAERIRSLRDHAQQGRHHHMEIGFNMRMEGIQAAVLDVKLRHLDAWNEQRRLRAEQYQRFLADIDGLDLPRCPDREGHIWHIYAVLARGRDRQRLLAQLAQRGIGAAIHYPTPVPLQPAYRHLGHCPGDFPVAENVMANCLSLPMFPELTDDQIAHVGNALREIMSACPISLAA